MRLAKLISLLVWCALSLSGQNPCSLQIHVVDLEGKELREGYFSISGLERRFEVAKEHVVPCGDALLSIRVPAFSREQVSLAIRPGFQVRTIGMKVALLDEIGDSERIVSIELLNYSQFKNCDRLRLAPLFRPHAVIETLVSGRGGAGVAGLVPATYSFILVGREGACGFAFKFVDAINPIRIRIEAFQSK